MSDPVIGMTKLLCRTARHLTNFKFCRDANSRHLVNVNVLISKLKAE